MKRREALLGSHIRRGLSGPIREDHIPVGIVLPENPAQPVTRANAGIVLGSLRNRVPGVARLGRWAGRRKIIHMLKIRFDVESPLGRGQSAPDAISSPVPFEVGQTVCHKVLAGPVTYVIVRTEWVVEDPLYGFYQSVSLKAEGAKNG